MSTEASPVVALRPVISDTGFLLSVAATELLLPVLIERWQGRALWPREVNTELVYRVQKPGRGVSARLAKGALHCGQKLAGAPVDLTPDQQERATLLANAIGGTGTREHAGEAAAAILARDNGGVIATEDGAASLIIRTNENIESITITALLKQLYLVDALSETAVRTILGDLQRENRPYVQGLTVDQVLRA